MRGKGEVRGLFWCRWQAHTQIPDNYSLKLSRSYLDTSHKSTEYIETNVLFVGAVTMALNK